MSRTEAFHGGAGVDTPMEHYGIEVVPAWRERDLRKWHQGEDSKETRQVPVSQIKAGQSTVDSRKVNDMARTPHSGEALTGKQLPDNEGVMLEDGHHRLAAAKLRGDSHLPVHIRWKHGPRYPGTEGRV